MTEATLKRTRRAVPFDDRIEVRCYKAEKARLLSEAEKREMSASDLVRSQLGPLLRTDAPEPIETPSAAPEPVQRPSVDLTEAIARGLGTTPGHGLLKIKLGKVTVRGERWPHTEIPADLLESVEVDGSPLRFEQLNDPV